MERLLHGIDALLIDRLDDARANFESLLRDTEQPIAERLLELIDLLERRDRLHSTYLSTLRHEIGNPLSIAQANLEGMVDGVIAPDRGRLIGVLTAVQAAGALMADMSREPREEDELMPIKLDTFNICALMNAHAASVAGVARAKGVSLAFRPQCAVANRTECVNFCGDARRVGQVLQNVLLNAVRYTPPGGRVEIDCDNAEGDLLVAVRDTGPGIPRGEITRIFEPGFRGERAEQTKGSGLGLSVVADLLRKLGGSARILSHEGSGTTFVISLPAARMELARPAAGKAGA